MFDLPDAKRIRRSDLASSPTSAPRSSPDPDLTALLRARLDQHLDLSIADDTAAIPVPAAPDDDDDDDELDFRLFAAPTQTGGSAETASAPVQKIRLTSPAADRDRRAGFVVPTRPAGYYFAPGLDGDSAKAAEYADAAVSGAEVVARAAATRWAGCGVPWKVEVVDACGRARARRLEGHVEVRGRGSGARRRKSKRARVAVRKKARARAERKEEAERGAREREEAERAKRTARNREKKVKRKEREKVKKAPAAAREDGGGEMAEDVVMGED